MVFVAGFVIGFFLGMFLMSCLVASKSDEQDRINRALEYIEIIENNESYGVKEKDYNNLVDILQGSDKE